MRLCMIGASPEARRCAVAMIQQGHEIYWLLSTEALRTVYPRAVGLSMATDILPATCQYIVPVQPYHFEGIRLLCINQEFWQRPDLHTRLFTCLCLLQHALPYAVFHTWGPQPIAYLTVYTARFLAVPAVLWYSSQLVATRSEQPFLWDWVAQQVSAVVVSSLAEQEHLLTLGPLTTRQVHVCDPEPPHFGQALTSLHAHLEPTTP